MKQKVNAWLAKRCSKVNMNNMNPKQILFNNPNLVAVSNNKEIIFDTDNQFLYMYPLNIIDYVNSIKNKKPIKLVVKNFKTDDSHKILKFVNNIMSDKDQLNRCVEFEIKHEIQDWNIVEHLFKIIFEKNIKIVLNFKSYLQLKDYNKVFKYVNCFKFSIYDCKGFNEALKDIKSFKKDKLQFLFAKIYLNQNQISNYYSFVKKLKKMQFDYVLFSKELIPEGQENIKIDPNIKYKLFKIKHVLEDEKFKIKLVKDLTTLYYPLFTLDDRNTKKCYASKVCNYLIEGKLYPCATKQILANNVLIENVESKKYIGTKCLDCASIFENDYLDKILKHGFNELKFINLTTPTIHPLGIGTFKFKSNYKQIKNSFIMGQNLIDCNLAYNNGKTLKNIAKYIRREQKNPLLYCKLYKTISKIEDIETQINEYLKILKVRSLNIVSIHSLDILKNIDLLEVYKELKRLQNVGKIKYLGLCNTNKEQLEQILKSGIQILTFEGVYNLFCKYYEICGLLDVCRTHNIRFIAYQPLLMGKFDLKQNILLKELAEKYDKTIPQILLNYYILHKDMMVLVKSSNLNHIIENSNYDFYIDDADYSKLDKMNINKNLDVNFDTGNNKVYLLSYKELKNV